MSKALDYLLETRPEAIGHYFSFLKKAGEHLDPKTRALISVITKVDAQTEKGFKQYLGRALREGASANEILDALLMAFPTLGLTKLVWAVDLIHCMNLPQFDPAAMAAETAGEWHTVAPLSELEAAGARAIECGGRILFVYRDGDSLTVYDNVCPHQGTPMYPEDLKDRVVTCQRHGWQFDLEQGKCIDGGDKPLRELPSRINDQQLEACW